MTIASNNTYDIIESQARAVFRPAWRGPPGRARGGSAKLGNHRSHLTKTGSDLSRKLTQNQLTFGDGARVAGSAPRA